MNDFNEPTQNPANYKYGMFYFNASDPRSIVPKMNQGLGVTFNFASVWSYFIIAVAIAASIWAFAK